MRMEDDETGVNPILDRVFQLGTSFYHTVHFKFLPKLHHLYGIHLMVGGILEFSDVSCSLGTVTPKTDDAAEKGFSFC